VELEAFGEKVQHLEKVKTENILDRAYDCWDVYTNRDRYWVISWPTSLYSHRYFPSLDYTLSFHVGVTFRVLSRQRGPADDKDKSVLHPVWRRWEDADVSKDLAKEAEDFQAVGMKCRECLIELVRETRKLAKIHIEKKGPKLSDVLGWSERIADVIAAGDRNGAIRLYLKSVVRSTWTTVNWLTHFKNATRMDTDFALNATQNVIVAFGMAVRRFEARSPERCPNCGSYAIQVDYREELEPNPYVSYCEKCDWERQEIRQKTSGE